MSHAYVHPSTSTAAAIRAARRLGWQIPAAQNNMRTYVARRARGRKIEVVFGRGLSPATAAERAARLLRCSPDRLVVAVVG